MSAFQVNGDSLFGHGVAFDVAALLSGQLDTAARSERLAEIAEVSFRQGRAVSPLSWDDRFELHAAGEALRALAVIVGPNPAGDRHRRAADLLARWLEDQEAGR